MDAVWIIYVDAHVGCARVVRGLIDIVEVPSVLAFGLQIHKKLGSFQVGKWEGWNGGCMT